MRDDRYYFDWCMMLAREAMEGGYSPVGAIVVVDNEEVYPAASRREIGNVLHAEFRALEAYSQQERGTSILYSTLEPCVMCGGMAAVLKVNKIKWLVSDVWAGITRTLNYNNAYVQKRFPTMDKIHLPVTDLHQEALDLWVKYLRQTGHADAVSFMLGLPEDYQCK
ncbi:MAG: hypothetical protein GY743_23240 [Planctomycetaceae bacterium]|nr:hypothetical protein [Planctomycetaceae bacterium]